MAEKIVLWLLGILAVPTVGMSSIFVISFISATLLPMGSEPAVFAVIKANSALFWPAILVATVGNTMGGAVNYWMGYSAKNMFEGQRKSRWCQWLQRFGAKTLLLSWLPAVGDLISTFAGWLKIPFWPSVAYMAIGKFLRYVIMTLLLLYVPDGVWHRFADWLG